MNLNNFSRHWFLSISLVPAGLMWTSLNFYNNLIPLYFCSIWIFLDRTKYFAYLRIPCYSISTLVYTTQLYFTLLHSILLYSYFTLLYSSLLYYTLLYPTLLYSTLLYSTLMLTWRGRHHNFWTPGQIFIHQKSKLLKILSGI